MVAIIIASIKNSTFYCFPVSMLHCRNVNNTYNFKFFSNHIKENKKKQMKYILIIYLIFPDL